MKGIYTLLLDLQSTAITIGSLGKIHFDGIYAYVGSAQNSMENRIARHFAKKKRLHWHIDYLTTSAKCKTLYALCSETSGRECSLGRSIGSKAEPVPGFGSSDCRCFSHLYGLHCDADEAFRFLLEAFSANWLGASFTRPEKNL